VYVRSVISGVTLPVQRAGWGTLGAFATTEQELYRQVHGWAVAIQQNQVGAQQAAARGDVAGAQRIIAYVGKLREYFAEAVTRWRAASEAADPVAMTAFDRLLVATGDWINQSLASLPGAIGAIPKAVIDGVLNVTGAAVGTTILYGGLAVLVLLWLLQQAERSRTYRRYVA